MNLATVNARHAEWAAQLARCAMAPDTTARERAEYRAEIVALARDVLINLARLDDLARRDALLAACDATRAAITNIGA